MVQISSGKLRSLTLKINERFVLANNPFWVSELIGSFNQGYGGKAPFELVYLVVPLVLRKDSRKKISTLNNLSTIYSAFLDGKDKRVRIAGLQRYVDYYKPLVIPSLIAYSNKGNTFGLRLDNGKEYHYSKINNTRAREYFKAAYNLGVVFSKESPKECFYKLGVFNV